MKDTNANSKSKPVQLLSLKETVSQLKYTRQSVETNHDDDSKGMEEWIALEAVFSVACFTWTLARFDQQRTEYQL
jgi:hypothetical protein